MSLTHIDGDRTNNTLFNLLLIEPGSQTEAFSSPEIQSPDAEGVEFSPLPLETEISDDFNLNHKMKK